MDERTDGQEERIKPRIAATIALLVANGLVYLFQRYAESQNLGLQEDEYFALSLAGLRHGYVWQLLTFQFMHGGWFHILFNSWAIYVFGRVVEMTIGARRMLTLYFLSGIAGGLLQMLGTLLLPGLFGDAACVGASAGAMGLIAAFAALYPGQKLFVLLFFVIPLRMKAMTLLWICIVTSVVGIVIPYGGIAHAAHLGGAITGYLFVQNLIRRHKRPPVIASPQKSELNVTTVQD